MTSRCRIPTEKGAVNKTQLLKDKEHLEILREQRAEKAASEQRAREAEAEIWADPAHDEVRSRQTALGADKELKQACEDFEALIAQVTIMQNLTKMKRKTLTPRPVRNLPIQQTLGRRPISSPGPDLDYMAEDSAEDSQPAQPAKRHLTIQSDDENEDEEQDSPSCSEDDECKNEGSEDVVSAHRAAVRKAMKEYTVRISTVNAFPDEDEVDLWTRECWENACEREGIEVPFTKDIRAQLSKMGPTVRGHVKEKAVSCVPVKFGLRRGCNPPVIQSNKLWVEVLLKDDGFVYEDPQEEIGLYESDLINDIIIEQWFHGRKSVG
ncbi:hypothetical protein M422DRAFT_244179 [Sphaerobolus stellatus SS14]|nr:hypothetical protein M422DRAFT_244179 [Sphaerobolus stellatus SS14]